MKTDLQTTLKPPMTRVIPDSRTRAAGSQSTPASLVGSSRRDERSAQRANPALHIETEDRLQSGKAVLPHLCALCVFLSLTMPFSGKATAATNYVWQESPNPTSPYSSWETAAHVIQDAVDAASDGDIVTVAPGEYEITQPIDFNQRYWQNQPAPPPKNLTLRSEAGPERTVIRMTYWNPVVFFRNGETADSRLEGFTLTGGQGWVATSSGNTAAIVFSEIYGGGIAIDDSSPEIRDCIIRGNEAAADPGQPEWGALYLYRTELRDCAITGNRGSRETIGLLSSRLTNCTIARNPAGGVSDYGVNAISMMLNSIVWGNGGTNNFPVRLVNGNSSLAFNCIEGDTIPAGEGNINTDPRLDIEGRLSPGSPCIDAGNNNFVTWATDLDGNPRILNGIVDMGAYEFVPNEAPIADASATHTLVVFANGACCPIHDGGQGNDEESDWSRKERTSSVPPARSLSPRADRQSRAWGGRLNERPGTRPGDPRDYCRLCATNALVVLNGSRSSDPDNDPLTYRWYSTSNAQPSSLLATGQLALVRLPAGIHPIDLVVDDGRAQATNTVPITVLTAEQAVQRLIWMVNASDWRQKRPLLASLEAALASIQRGNCNSARGQLGTLQNKVRAHADDLELTRQLIGGAKQVITVLGGEDRGQPSSRIRSWKRHPGDCMHIRFDGEAGLVYLVEASTNLVDWEAICAVQPDGAGGCEFQDHDAPQHQSRFYRVVEQQ